MLIKGKLVLCFTSSILVSTLSMIYMYHCFPNSCFIKAVSPALTTDKVQASRFKVYDGIMSHLELLDCQT